MEGARKRAFRWTGGACPWVLVLVLDQYLSMLTGRQIAFMIFAFFKVNDVKERTESINDLLHVELVNENPKSSIKPGKNLDVVGEGTRRKSFGILWPSTVVSQNNPTAASECKNRFLHLVFHLKQKH